MTVILRCLLAVALCTLAAACAGYRGGWESIAYIGDAPPAAEPDPESPARPMGERELEVPGAKLRVSIDNRLRTYDAQVYFFVVPLSVDPREVYPQNHEPGKTRVFVNVTPEGPGFVFRPTRAWLEIDGKRYAPVRGFRFGMWDEQGRLVEKGGKYDHREIAGELALTEPGRRYLLSLVFDVPVPAPESRGIALDLSGALRDAARPPLPLIRFAPVRWKEGYT